MERVCFAIDDCFKSDFLHPPFQSKSDSFLISRTLTMWKKWFESNTVFVKWIQCTFLVIILLLLVNTIDKICIRQKYLSIQAFNTETPEILLAKINMFRNRSDGKKVAFIGSSLLGSSELAAHSQNWKSHTFDQVLEKLFKKHFPQSNKPVWAANFGLKGSTIADQKQIYSVITNSQPVDLVVVAINLESFSMKHSEAKKHYSRDWIRDIANNKPNLFNINPIDASSLFNPNLALHSYFLNQWPFYADRDILQQMIFRDNPSIRLRNLWGKLNDSFLKTGKSKKESEFIQKKHESYDDIDLSSNNYQVQSLQEWVGLLKKRHQKTIIFYAPENPAKISQMIESTRYKKLLRQLDALMGTFQSEGILYIPMPENFSATFPKEGYDDPIHLSAYGIEYYSDHILFSEAAEKLGFAN
jgi:hypothetical protein